MSTTRADLRKLIRSKLNLWYDQTTINMSPGGIDAVTTTLVLAANPGSRIAERTILEVGDELIEVTSATASPSFTVIRGTRGTTAAAHVHAKAVKVHSDWALTEGELNSAINQATDWLKPLVWTLAYHEASFTENIKEFALPTGVEIPEGDEVLELAYKDANDDWVPIYGWLQMGDTIRLRLPMPSTETMRIARQKYQARLTDDVTTLDLATAEEAIALRATKTALEILLANRVRYLSYSATLDDRASTPDELQRTIFYYANQAILARDQIARPQPPTFAKTYR